MVFSNFITFKFSEDLTGPDLGSDDSPRSSVNASEWMSLLDDSSDCQRNVTLFIFNSFFRACEACARLL